MVHDMILAVIGWGLLAIGFAQLLWGLFHE